MVIIWGRAKGSNLALLMQLVEVHLGELLHVIIIIHTALIAQMDTDTFISIMQMVMVGVRICLSIVTIYLLRKH